MTNITPELSGIYGCCEHCEHPPRSQASITEWQAWHIRPCEAECAPGHRMPGDWGRHLTVTSYVIQGARELIAQAERGDLDKANAGELAVWVGKATATLRELTRDA